MALQSQPSEATYRQFSSTDDRGYSDELRAVVRTLEWDRKHGRAVPGWPLEVVRALGDRLIVSAFAAAVTADPRGPFVGSARLVANAIAMQDPKYRKGRGRLGRPRSPESVARDEAKRYAKGAGARALESLLLDCGRAIDAAGTGNDRTIVGWELCKHAIITCFPQAAPVIGWRPDPPLARIVGAKTLAIPRSLRSPGGGDARRALEVISSVLDGRTEARERTRRSKTYSTPAQPVYTVERPQADFRCSSCGATWSVLVNRDGGLPVGDHSCIAIRADGHICGAVAKAPGEVREPARRLGRVYPEGMPLADRAAWRRERLTGPAAGA